MSLLVLLNLVEKNLVKIEFALRGNTWLIPGFASLDCKFTTLLVDKTVVLGQVVLSLL